MVVLRAIYFSLGCLFFIVGFIGAFVPVLPTTIFMILALWMFSKSSVQFHDWLYNHKYFGPLLQQWQQYRVIPLSAKIFAISMMAVSFVFGLIWQSIFGFNLPGYVSGVVGGLTAVPLWDLLKRVKPKK